MTPVFSLDKHPFYNRTSVLNMRVKKTLFLKKTILKAGPEYVQLL